MRDIRRPLLSFLLVTCALIAPRANAQESVEQLPATTEAALDASAEDANTKQQVKPGLLDKVDGATGVLNDVIGTVFFYDVGGKNHSVETAGLPIPTELETLVGRMFDEASFNLEVSELTLSLPVGTTEAQRDAAEKSFRELWSARTGKSTKESSKALTVEVKKASDEPSIEDGGTSLAAHRAGIPLTVLWLILGAVYFTFRMGFINLRGFKHAIKLVQGKYDKPEDEGEVSHFQALASALSATVGLGNIAGVAIAIAVGGPGATFWLIVAGFFGMTAKFVECTLGQKYRQVRSDGSVMGGAMYYLSAGLAEKKLGGLGKVLAVFFAIICIGASFGGGNTFQVNQSLNALKGTVPFLADNAEPIIGAFATTAGPNTWIYGLVMAILVGIVILGGIQRIAATAEKIVPVMCLVYVVAAMFVILSNISAIPAAVETILSSAFGPDAMYGGFLGVLVVGFQRAAFSNEAGIGSAAIAHSAAKTEYPVQEGIVALLEPFIDTIIVCTMTALVIVITGAYEVDTNPVFGDVWNASGGKNGAGLTAAAFESAISWFPMILAAAVMLFAFSTMISWSYYGERCWVYLFGDGTSIIYRVVFLFATFAGSVITSQNILDFGDLMILGMAFPNVLGVLILSGDVRRDLAAYWGKLKSGEVREYE